MQIKLVDGNCLDPIFHLIYYFASEIGEHSNALFSKKKKSSLLTTTMSALHENYADFGTDRTERVMGDFYSYTGAWWKAHLLIYRAA